jgi:hypothetical protein
VVPNKNVQKRKARPKRSIDNPGDDHDLGLWIDYDLLRKHRNHSPTVLHATTAALDNRYLQLADLALGTNKAKKKSKGAVSGE